MVHPGHYLIRPVGSAVSETQQVEGIWIPMPVKDKYSQLSFMAFG